MIIGDDVVLAWVDVPVDADPLGSQGIFEFECPGIGDERISIAVEHEGRRHTRRDISKSAWDDGAREGKDSLDVAALVACIGSGEGNHRASGGTAEDNFPRVDAVRRRILPGPADG